ncbi:MAG: UPF0182 family protein [Streptosporangiales bacterium]|nr:UPF0182 family protein [Streptosporangiales bacterium]
MTFRTPGAGRAARVPRRPRLLAPVAAAVVVIIALIGVLANYWTDYLWFKSVNFTTVFGTQLWTKIWLFVIGGLIMALFVGANLIVAYRLRPAYRPLSLEQQGLERYRVAIDPHRKIVVAVVAGVLALLAGSSAAGEWRSWLMFSNRTSFGAQDAQFHVDISFFTFTYPFLRVILGYVFAAVILSFFAAAITHYLYGGLRLQSQGERASPAARAHLSVLLGVFVLLKAVAYWLDRYGLAYSDRTSLFTGPSYTDVNAVLPAKTILAVIAVICAVLFFANVVRRGAMLPIVGLGLLVLSAVLIGGVYPALVEQFQVRPNQADKEAPYIARGIKATRTAYGIDGTKITSYSAKTELSSSELAGEAEIIPSVRLLDPTVVSQTFQQLQQVRNFYQFPEQLDIDRYPTDDVLTDTVVAVREMEGPPEGRQNWINQHLVYTHGFGFVAAPGNRVDTEGRPDFTERDIPPSGDLGKFEPRVYFGEQSNNYAVVGAPQKAAPRELDYPDNSEGGQKNNTYSGKGGVPVGGLLERALFAVKFREKNLLLSGAISEDSRILFERTPAERVRKVAPFLTLEGNTYPAIVGGRVVWIVDGYTTSNGYPYSQRVSLGDATRDTNTQAGRVRGQPSDQVNYVRNSVKATVDAYDGTVKLYQWDAKDPVLRTWMKVFPGVVQPRNQIKADLMQHLRYPEDLFKVQREILSRYHVTNAQSFYGGQDFWQVPADPTRPGGAPEPPYRITLKMPDDQEPGFSLTTTFVPRGRENLSAFMAVDSVPTSPNYGKIQVLELPRSQAIPGPRQVQNAFQSDTTVSSELLPLNRSGAQTVFGNLLTLPFGGGLLYVEPVYVKSTAAGQSSYPILRKVMVAFGNDVGIGDNLQDALNQVFQGAPPGEEPPEDGGEQPPPTGDGGQVSPELRSALNEASNAYDSAQEALKNGDWAAYGEAQKRLQEALNKADTEIRNGGGG